MAGDFGKIARSTEAGAAEFIARLALRSNDRVLDIACGTGNLAIPAARTGAHVTGIDIAPNLLEQAWERAHAEGLHVAGDPAATVETFRTYFGPVMYAFAALSPEAQHALRQDLEEHWSAHNRAQDGTTQVDSTYLEVIAVRR